MTSLATSFAVKITIHDPACGYRRYPSNIAGHYSITLGNGKKSHVSAIGALANIFLSRILRRRDEHPRAAAICSGINRRPSFFTLRTIHFRAQLLDPTQYLVESATKASASLR